MRDKKSAKASKELRTRDFNSLVQSAGSSARVTTPPVSTCGPSAGGRGWFAMEEGEGEEGERGRENFFFFFQFCSFSNFY